MIFQKPANLRRHLRQRLQSRSDLFASIAPRTRPNFSASRYRATSIFVNALVEATPISGPAWRYTTESLTRLALAPNYVHHAQG